jgi:manganese/zinc/iron transport system permease protein
MLSNPYSQQTFIGFFIQFAYRFWALITGQLSIDHLVTDEIQICVLIGVAASSALVGTFLVLKRLSMLANSLSHTILVGIVLAYVLTGNESDHSSGDFVVSMHALLLASLAMGFLTTFLTEWMTKVGRLQEDASIGLVFTTLFALGIILVTLLTHDAHIGVEAVMGNVDALLASDLYWVYWILLFNFFLFTLFFKEFKITTFDPALATALGFSVNFFNYLLMTQVSATSIGAFRAVGVLLVLAFMTGPVLAARLLTHHLKTLLGLSVAVGVSSSIVGVALSRHVLTVYGSPLSTSGLVVCVIVGFYLFIGLAREALNLFFRKKLTQFNPRNTSQVTLQTCMKNEA